VQDEEIHPGELAPLVTSPDVQREQDQNVADDRDEEDAGQYGDLPFGEILVSQIIGRKFKRRRGR